MAKMFDDFDKIMELDSTEPFDDGLKNMNKIFIISAIVFGILGFVDGEIGLIPGALLGALIGWVIIEVAMNFKANIYDFRVIKFRLSCEYSSESDLNEALPEIFKDKGVEVYKTVIDHDYALKHDGMIYDVILNDDNTFSLHWRLPIHKAFLGKRLSLVIYRKLVVSMPILAYAIQKYQK